MEDAASLGEGAPGRERRDDHGLECGIEEGKNGRSWSPDKFHLTTAGVLLLNIRDKTKKYVKKRRVKYTFQILPNVVRMTAMMFFSDVTHRSPSRARCVLRNTSPAGHVVKKWLK